MVGFIGSSYIISFLSGGGIPQGSALGPLLFVIYMNNLPLQITDGLLVQYADDTTLVVPDPLLLLLLLY